MIHISPDLLWPVKEENLRNPAYFDLLNKRYEEVREVLIRKPFLAYQSVYCRAGCCVNMIYASVCLKDAKMLKMLLEVAPEGFYSEGLSSDQYHISPLFAAVSNDWREGVILLLTNKKLDPNIGKRNSHVQSGGIEFNERDCKWESEEISPLYLACNEGKIGMVELLLEDPRVDRKTGMKRTEGEGDIYNKDAERDTLTTPLEIAKSKGQKEIVELLSTNKGIIE